MSRRDDKSWWAYVYEINTLEDGPFRTWAENLHYGVAMAYDVVDLKLDLEMPYERVEKLIDESDSQWTYIDLNMVMATRCGTREEAERTVASWVSQRYGAFSK